MDDALLTGQRRSTSSSASSAAPPVVVSVVDGRTGFILTLICLLTFGVYYCYDLPAALSSDFKGLAGGSSTHYELLYSIYSLPNIVLPVAGGALSDGKFGPHRCAFAACAIVAAGSALVAVAVGASSFPLAVAGRFVMGVGGETAFGLQQTLCSYWFATSLQPLAMSVTLTTGNLGEVLNFLATKRLEKAVGFKMTMWLAVVPCVLSALAAAWLGALANPPAGRAGRATASTTSTTSPLIGGRNVGGGDLEAGPSCTAARADYRGVSDENNATATAAAAPPAAAAAAADDDDDNGDGDDGEHAGARPRTLWDTARGVLGRDAVLLYMVNMAALGNYFIFPSIAADLLHERWPGSNSASSSSSSSSKKGLTGDDAGFLLAAFFAIPMVLAPVFGAIIGGEHDTNEASTTATSATSTSTIATTSEDDLDGGGSGPSGSTTKEEQEEEQQQQQQQVAAHATSAKPLPTAAAGAAAATKTAARRKRRTLHLWLAAGCAGNTAGFLLLVALPPAALPPTVGVVGVAIATTVVSASLTPALALAVREEFHGTAFGVWSSSQNVAMTGIALAVGLLADEFSPVASVFFLAMCGAAATGVSLLSLGVITSSRG